MIRIIININKKEEEITTLTTLTTLYKEILKNEKKFNLNKKKGSGVRGSLRVIIALFQFRPISHISIYVYYRMNKYIILF